MLDWSRLKWTNELERIWNVSLSQSALILDTIGEDSIKTVLSWIVITRIVIAHIYTFTYVTNIYPILTWSRPNLLMPWLILSFFKNIVLEVIVIVIGLLLWYESRFSIFVFLEFIFVKLIPLFLAIYNWYSNSRLFLQLRHIEKTQKLKRTMQSDTNLLANRLYTKLEDSKYRTRSLTTLLSCESYETYDTQDTISHIIDNSSLTPMKKTTMLLGLTENDIKDARDRVRKRAEHSRLTELEDESFAGSTKRDANLLFAVNNDYPPLKMNIESSNSDTALVKVASFATNELSPIETGAQVENLDVENLETEIAKKSEDEGTREAKETSEPCFLTKKRGDTDVLDTKRTERIKMCSSCDTKDFKTISFQRKKEIVRFGSAKQTRRFVDRGCSPVKLQALLNCNCVHGEDCLQLVPTEVPRTSTPEDRKQNTRTNTEDDPVDRQKTPDVAYDVTNVKTNFTLEKTLQNNLEIPETVETDDRSLENLPTENDFSTRRIQHIKDNKTTFVSNVTDCDNTSIDVLNFSEIVEDSSVTDVTADLDTLGTAERNNDTRAETDHTKLQTMTILKPTDDDCTNSTQNVSSHPYTLDTEKDASKPKLPENILEGTNLPRFFGGSMMVFDGCYEKDFDKNLELQCLLQQMEKKEWNPFASQTNFEKVHTTMFSRGDDKVEQPSQDSETVHSPEDDFKWRDINDDRPLLFFGSTPEGTPLRENQQVDQPVSKMVQANGELVNDIPRKSSNVSVTDSIDSTRSVHTQTNEDFIQPTSSNNSFAQKKKRKRYLKRQYFYNRNRSVSPINSEKYRAKKTDSCISLLKDELKSPVAPAPAPQKLSACASNNSKKKLDSTKSWSYKSECECEMQKLEAKYCGSSDSRFGKKNQNRKTTTKPKMDDLFTLGLTQMTRQANPETMVYRKKPPVYPKNTKKELQTNVSNAKQPTAKQPTAKQLESHESKRSTNKRLSSKKHKSVTDEVDAREIKALKAYNEITLLEDKKKLESRKKPPFVKDTKDRNVKDSRNYHYARKRNLNRLGMGIDDDKFEWCEVDLNKENLFVDTTTETDPSTASSSKDKKLPNLASFRRSFDVSNEKYICPNLAAVNKVTGKLLDNYDRVHARHDVKNDRPVHEWDRKPYTKFRKSRKPIDEENLSANSSKKLEGTQRGRELDRTPAKENVRDRTSPLGPSTVLDPVTDAESLKYRSQVTESSFEYDHETVLSTSADDTVFEAPVDLLLKQIRSFVFANNFATWSSSTVDEVEDIQAVSEAEENESLVVEDEEMPKLEEDEKETIEKFQVPEAVSIHSFQAIEEKAPTRPEVEENRRTDTWRGDRERRRTSPDMTDFIRNIEVNRLGHGIVLANTNAQGRKSHQRDIIGDKTARMVHNAFFHNSMDSLLDLPSDFLTVDEMLNNRHLDSSVDGFVCRASNRSIDVFVDELPVILRPESQLGQTIVATIREAQDSSRSENNCDLCIITVDSDNLTNSSVISTLDSYEDAEEHVPSSLGELPIGELFSSLTECFKCLNINDLNTIATARTPILFDIVGVSNIDQTGTIRNLDANTSEEEHEETEERKETQRIVDEEIFTDIEFPIVIKVSDLIPGFSNIRNDRPRPTTPMIGYVEPTRMDLPSIETRRKEETDRDQRLQDMRTIFATGTDLTLEFSSGRTNDSELDPPKNEELSDDSKAEFVPKSDSLANFSDSKLEEFCLNSSKGTNDFRHSPLWESLNVTFEIMNAENLNEVGVNKIEIREIDECFRDDDMEDFDTRYNVWENMEEGIEDVGTKDEEMKDTVDIVEVEGGTDLEEDGKRFEDVDESFTVEEPEEEEEENAIEHRNDTDLKNEICLTTVFSFWSIVIYFYVRYFYQTYFHMDIRNAISTMKPYEVHAMPTSTSTLLENIKLVERIGHENLPEVNEENDDETYQNSIDIESTEISSSIVQHDFTFTETSAENSHIERNVHERTMKDTEETLTSLVERIAKILEKSSVYEPEDDVEKRDILDPPITESRDAVGDLSSKISNESFRSLFVVEKPPLTPFSIQVQTNDNDLRPVKESNAIATNTRLTICELEEQDLINLSPSKQDATTFEFQEIEASGSEERSLLEEDRSKLPENNQSEEIPTDAKISRQDEPNEIQDGGGERTSNPRMIESKEKSMVVQTRDSIPVENEGTTVDNVEPPVQFETTLEEMDSFDSAYSVFNEVVQNAASFADFDSVMEEFSITSNVSDNDAR
ncbi:uncharacterized protein LOC143148495 isoform X1 [Ptiloglossa arizonensis]|uniref:uncharacterized protein LOC143148495 isoform X1 n=1 Tax=Ptiloglossa arizonensis TaxID=3350558 RepID=UPI003FA0FE16